jgi:membrane associated rhomboid family serine protease
VALDDAASVDSTASDDSRKHQQAVAETADLDSIGHAMLHCQASREEVLAYRRQFDRFAIRASRKKPWVLMLAIVAFLAGLGYSLARQKGITSTAANPLIGPAVNVLAIAGAKISLYMLFLNEWWRLLTPLWLHAGVIDTVLSIVVLIRTGTAVEKRGGSLLFAFTLLASGAAGVLLSVVFATAHVTVAGSGASMGIAGAYLACLLQNSQEFTSSEFRAALVVGLSGMACLFVLGFVGPISDNWTNVGGLVVGFACGAAGLTRRGVKGNWSVRQMAVAISTAGLAVGMIAAAAVMAKYQVFAKDFCGNICAVLTCAPLPWWSCQDHIPFLFFETAKTEGSNLQRFVFT